MARLMTPMECLRYLKQESEELSRDWPSRHVDDIYRIIDSVTDNLNVNRITDEMLPVIYEIVVVFNDKNVQRLVREKRSVSNAMSLTRFSFIGRMTYLAETLSKNFHTADRSHLEVNHDLCIALAQTVKVLFDDHQYGVANEEMGNFLVQNSYRTLLRTPVVTSAAYHEGVQRFVNFCIIRNIPMEIMDDILSEARNAISVDFCREKANEPYVDLARQTVHLLYFRKPAEWEHLTRSERTKSISSSQEQIRSFLTLLDLRKITPIEVRSLVNMCININAMFIQHKKRLDRSNISAKKRKLKTDIKYLICDIRKTIHYRIEVGHMCKRGTMNMHMILAALANCEADISRNRMDVLMTARESLLKAMECAADLSAVIFDSNTDDERRFVPVDVYKLLEICIDVRKKMKKHRTRGTFFGHNLSLVLKKLVIRLRKREDHSRSFTELLQNICRLFNVVISDEEIEEYQEEEYDVIDDDGIEFEKKSCRMRDACAGSELEYGDLPGNRLANFENRIPPAARAAAQPAAQPVVAEAANAAQQVLEPVALEEEDGDDVIVIQHVRPAVDAEPIARRAVQNEVAEAADAAQQVLEPVVLEEEDDDDVIVIQHVRPAVNAEPIALRAAQHEVAEAADAAQQVLEPIVYEEVDDDDVIVIPNVRRAVNAMPIARRAAQHEVAEAAVNQPVAVAQNIVPQHAEVQLDHPLQPAAEVFEPQDQEEDDDEIRVIRHLAPAALNPLLP